MFSECVRHIAKFGVFNVYHRYESTTVGDATFLVTIADDNVILYCDCNR